MTLLCTSLGSLGLGLFCALLAYAWLDERSDRKAGIAWSGALETVIAWEQRHALQPVAQAPPVPREGDTASRQKETVMRGMLLTALLAIAVAAPPVQPQAPTAPPAPRRLTGSASPEPLLPSAAPSASGLWLPAPVRTPPASQPPPDLPEAPPRPGLTVTWRYDQEDATRLVATVYVRVDSGAWQRLGTTTPGATSYHYAGAQPGAEYCFAVAPQAPWLLESELPCVRVPHPVHVQGLTVRLD